ncbi:NTF2-like protein [Aspergillus heteromorphus CBS 117.55]|uniref:NTF2-like protein n=1 Tax=Aspergillus heteromorphus CBS 117.55 TaxID=1448321 RepID=A0A317UXK8_9EURO|nr:NTF2-like protein [Aspergillus heteromorphus CBS 117.55]PWY66773.1 NTF2-like protein [Aspergillus heteromorphus CBS 117.55]
MASAKITFEEARDCEETVFERAQTDRTMSAATFVDMISRSGFLGDPLLRTQHLIGATKWRKVDDHRIEGCHQKLIKVKSHGTATITYVQVES